ncbi:mitochondrial ribonuclease P catalytic subunit [Dendroctonus ponderosae]|nr:mitochondrial ribonuclease P catalytic subunit [Dendroctonus ponderosae]KAH1018156.1 hypothetical protein HUJ05_005971 [Dendroctonus ponderosae]
MFFRKLSGRLLRCGADRAYSYSKTPSAFTRAPIRTTPDDLLKGALETVKPVKEQDWDQLKSLVLSAQHRGMLRDDNIDGMIMVTIAQLKRIDLAKSYLDYLKANGTKPNLATAGRYLSILYEHHRDNISKPIESEIVAMCSEMRTNNPILDSKTLDFIVRALSLTKDWRKCLEFMKEIKLTGFISTATYNAMAAAAFRNTDEKLAWSLLREALESEKTLSSTPFLAYLKTLKRLRKREDTIKGLEKMFKFFKESEIPCHEGLVDDIIQSFKLGEKTTVTFAGKCRCCGAKLDQMELTDGEFADLRALFFANAIVGKDIFIKSNPEEMARFQDFIANMAPHDVVLDGLNVAYSIGVKSGAQYQSKLLANVVSHFREQNKTVLVLGRMHMNRWPRDKWDFVRRNATLFLTQNISQDDPYLLYCALKSGKDTIVVTRDLMRNHRFVLKDRKYKVLFNRWLTQRQYMPLNCHSRRVTFKKPPDFSAIAQEKWHVPYTPKTGPQTDESHHQTWLCIDCS